MNHDITFCPNEGCDKLDCKRHWSHHPWGVPFSAFAESPKKDDGCEMYWPGYVEDKNENSRNTPV